MRQKADNRTELTIAAAVLLLLFIIALYSCDESLSKEAVPGTVNAFTGPLRVNQLNSCYFTDDSGKSIYLAGSHTWTNLKDRGVTDPPEAFDYAGYLDLLAGYGHNLIRLWTWELTKYQSPGKPIQFATPFPWSRTGPGMALDGKPKFDLSKFDQTYFDRLRSRVVAAGDRGIYVSIMLFEGHALHQSMPPWRWNGHPFHIGNNINGINGDPNGDGKGLETHTLELQAVTVLQEAYVRKIIDTVNDLDNVLYETANESHRGSDPWQNHMIDFIHAYEMKKAKQHPVVYTGAWGYDGSELWRSRAEAVSPGWPSPDAVFVPYRDDPPANDGKKIVINDTDHLWGLGGDRSWVWKSFTRGLNPVYMDDLGSGENRKAVRRAMGHTLSYAGKMNLNDMRPRNDLASTSYCLADPGSEYLIYKRSSRNPLKHFFTVNLEAGTYRYEWFNPRSGVVVSTGSFIVGEGKKFFSPPFSFVVLNKSFFSLRGGIKNFFPFIFEDAVLSLVAHRD